MARVFLRGPKKEGPNEQTNSNGWYFSRHFFLGGLVNWKKRRALQLQYPRFGMGLVG